MIILRNKLYSKGENDDIDGALATASGVGGIATLGTVKKNRLTGKVVRYHDAPTEVIDKIKEEGLKTKYADDPKNLTNQALKDIPKEDKTGKIYTAKSKKGAFSFGIRRSQLRGEIPFNDVAALNELRKGKSPHHKVLKIELDYDEDIKGKKHIQNPELRGAKNAKEFYNKKPKGLFEPKDWDGLDPIQKAQQQALYDSLSEKNVHIFDHDIDPSKIVGGKGYKKRTLKQVMKYIKNNPKRFGKEAGKVALGASLLGYGAKKAVDSISNKDKE